MRLPKNILSGTYTKPRVFLCETDGTKMCQLDVTGLSGKFSFNAISEIDFTVSRFYNDALTGELKVNPYYDKVEALRLIDLEDFGIFEIQGPNIEGDGINETKSINAKSLEYTLSQRYIKNFAVNTGEIGSVEVTYDESSSTSVVFYDTNNKDLSLLHLILKQSYGWDIWNNTVSKTGDGTTKQFTINPPFEAILTVSVGGVPTTEYSYVPSTGVLTFNTAPSVGNKIDIVCDIDEYAIWSIGHVDDSLTTLSRKFDIDRQSVYDFIMNEVCSSFNCYAVFDTYKKEINFYAESRTDTLIGDGVTTQFALKTPFHEVKTVSVDGYKTTQYSYNSTTGILTLTTAPASGVYIDVVDGGLDNWETDVFITFDNLVQNANVNYDADSIKTVLTVTYGDDDDNIRESNLGSSDLVDLSYYHTVEWMGESLYNAYTAYLQKQNNKKVAYSNKALLRTALNHQLGYEMNKLSLHYEPATNVTSTTSGTYYVKKQNTNGDYYYEVNLPSDYEDGTTYYSSASNGYAKMNAKSDTIGVYYIRGGDAPNYTYQEVNLPSQFNNQQTYYRQEFVSVNERKMATFYKMLKKYFMVLTGQLSGDDEEDTTIWNKYFSSETYVEDLDTWSEYFDDESFKSDFEFVESDRNTLHTQMSTIMNQQQQLAVSQRNIQAADTVIGNFLDKIWVELGKTPLEEMFLTVYQGIHAANSEAGWSSPSNTKFGLYYPVTLMISSLEKAIKAIDTKIAALNTQIDTIDSEQSAISDTLSMDTNFTKSQLARLNAFLREDELRLDNIVTTDLDSLNDTFKVQQDAMESAKIELSKISQPQLQFSATMDNIYAMPEFEPIINQFQLGNVIKVGIRDNYIKQSRLLSVDIDFEDLSSLSVQFGELTSLTQQSDIHADLLSQAIQAGKQVATSAGIWTSGADTATETELKIQQGLISATNSLKSMDSDQAVEWDNSGIHLRKWKDSTQSEYAPEQGWITNNKFLYSDDGFKTAKSVFGEYQIGDDTYWGLLAEAVIAGYIEGSTIVGSDINIGNGAFVVNGTTGQVTMGGGSGNITHNIDGYATDAELQSVTSQISAINNSKMYRVEVSVSGSQFFRTSTDTATLTATVYSWDEECTDDFNASAFNWVRTSSNSNEDTAWNNNSDHKGKKSITITSADVTNNASFSCELNIPDAN